MDSSGKESPSENEMDSYYNQSLAGDYSIVRDKFKTLYNDIMQNPEIYTSEKASIAGKIICLHSDMQCMTGNHADCSKTLNTIYATEILPALQNMRYLYLKRQYGHNLRLNFLLNQAASKYQECIQLQIDQTSFYGEIMTNLAETFCWVSPKKALNYAELSITFNKKFSNKLEQSKAYSSQVISYSLLGSFENAEESYQKAKNISVEAQYEAGILFSEVAAIVLHISQNQYQEADEKLKLAKLRIEKIEVYNTFLPLIYILCGKHAEARDSMEKLQCIPNTNQAMLRIKHIANQIKTGI